MFVPSFNSICGKYKKLKIFKTIFRVQSWSLHTAKSGVNRDVFSQNIKTVSNWWNRKETSKFSKHFLSVDQSLSVGSSSPDQESKNTGSKSEQSREDARP